MSNLSTLPKGDSAWLLRKAIERIIQQVSVLETNIGASTSGNSANTQIIFNDNGTLRGDAGLVYNKTTDALTVAGLVTAGSATITGDLTVDTSTLKVDSTNNRVGIGTASPGAGYILDVVGNARITSGAGVVLILDKTGAAALQLNNSGNAGAQLTTGITGGLSIYTANGIGGALADRYNIDSTGISTWSVAGTTAMTLDSTGLGIGAVANAKLDVAGAATVVDSRGQLYIHTTDAAAIDVGAQLTLGGVYTGSNNYAFGGIAARKENGTTNVAGYLDFLTTTSAGALTSRMRIDSSGNVGIGVTPSVKLDVLSAAAEGTIRLTSTIDGSNASPKASSLSLRSGTSSVETARIASFNRFANVGGGDLVFSTADTSGVLQTRATIDSSGNLLVGTTGSLSSFADGRIEVLAIASSYCLVADATATSAAAIGIRGNDSTVAASFYNASTGGTVGSIVINSGGVSYNTTSDYRLKESVKPISGGLARVNALKPSIYNWKSNGSTGEGFIAHELAEVVPFAVSGEKDAMNADGTIKSQGIDMSRIVPILVAAIQELTARVQTLEAR